MTNPPFKIDVSARIQRLPPYLFGRINKMKYEKRVAGIDIIDLGMGNPTDPTPDCVVDKLKEAAVDPRNHRYSVSNGIADVVSGNNSVISPGTGQVLVPGFTAGPGFDVASGWGTINARLFVPALVNATSALDKESAARQEASQELSQLQQAITLTVQDIPPGGISLVSASGFLPGHPVQLAVDGNPIVTLTASTLGTIGYILDPAEIGVAAGSHTLTMRSMLITTSASFTSG